MLAPFALLLLAADPVATAFDANVTFVGSFSADLDVNGKKGRVLLEEVSWRGDERIDEVIHKGDVIRVLPLRRADLDNVQLYSRRLALPDPWPHIREQVSDGVRTRATVIGLHPRGYLVRIAPDIELVLERADSLREHQPGDTLELLPVLYSGGTLSLLAAKEVAPRTEAFLAALKKLKVGEVRKASVKKISPYVVFVSLADGVEVPLQQKDLKRSVLSRFTVGQELRVKVKQLDLKRERISLSEP